jgi:hypothetical protein
MNNITIELCAEDRARIDKLTEALTTLASAKAEAVKTLEKDPNQQDINDMLKKALHLPTEESPKNAPEAPENLDHPTLDPFPEQPTAAEPAPKASVKEVTTAELQQLVITLCRAGKKPKVVEVLTTYGVQTVSAIPEDKRSEAYATLKALEG